MPRSLAVSSSSPSTEPTASDPGETETRTGALCPRTAQERAILRTILVVLLFLLGAFGAAIRASPVVLRPTEEPAEERTLRRSVRQLPGLVERWRCDCDPKTAVVEDGIVYILGYRRLFAVEVQDGSLVWDGGLENATARHRGRAVVLTEDRVVTAFGSEVVLQDRVTGVQVGRIDLGSRVEELEGPPLVATRRLPGSLSAKELIRIDAGSGQVLARTTLDGHPRVLVHGSGLYVTRFQDRGRLLIRLDPKTLAVVAEWPGPGGSPFPSQEEPRLWFVSNHDRGITLHAFDPSSGEWSTTEVETGTTRVFGGRRLGFAEIPGEWNGQPRGFLRYDPATGAVLWSTPLPCRPGLPVKDRNRWVLTCGWETGGAGMLLFLDPDSGEVLETLEGPGRGRIVPAGNGTWILVTGKAIVSVDPERRSAPRAETEPVETAIQGILDGIRRSSPPVDLGDVEALLGLGPGAWPVLTERLPERNLLKSLTVAEALGEARYEPAAPAVAALLDGLPPEGDRSERPPGAVANPPERVLLEVLARIGGADQVPSVGRVLLDETQPWAIREEAAFTLAAIGDPAVLPWIDRFSHRLSERGEQGSPGPATIGGDGGIPDREEERIRNSIRRHVARFGGGEGPTPVCPPGETGAFGAEEATERDCLFLRIQELDEVEGAPKIADRLPLAKGERRYVLSFPRTWRTKTALFRMKRIGDRWLVRSVWNWIR